MTSKVEKQVNAIREKIYEETKHMSNAEKAAFFNESARKAAKKYGFTIVGDEPSATVKVRNKKSAKAPVKPRAKSHA